MNVTERKWCSTLGNPVRGLRTHPADVDCRPHIIKISLERTPLKKTGSPALLQLYAGGPLMEEDSDDVILMAMRRTESDGKQDDMNVAPIPPANIAETEEGKIDNTHGRIVEELMTGESLRSSDRSAEQ